MNEIVNKVLLAEDIFMPEMHLNQPEFTDSADLVDMQFTSKLTKELVFYHVLLIFLVNMHGLFLKIKKAFLMWLKT